MSPVRGTRRLAAPALLALALGACTSGTARLPAPGAPPPNAWADTLPIEEPEGVDGGEDFGKILTESLVDEAGHHLSLSRRIAGIRPALNVTAFDDVVPSAWYEPDRRGMSPREAAEGPPGEGPDMDGPLTVIAGKLDGATPGFTIEDRKGDVYLLKFDPPGFPGMSSNADVVTSRIFWAAGYHVPKDVAVRFRPDDLELGDDAEVEVGGEDRAMTWEDVEEALSRTAQDEDGWIHALASLYLEGSPKGPFAWEGTRDDDPNDYYPHQDRRELRGVWALAQWTNHVDLRRKNTLDMFIEPTGYLRHNIIDFGTTLGSGSVRPMNPQNGMENTVDLPAIASRLVTLGAYEVGWEDMEGEIIHPSIGWLSAETFEPAKWRPILPNEAHRRMAAPDGYWGAKLVAGFERAHLEAIMAEAWYPPEAADTLLDILLVRQEKVVRHWYGQVAPVEDVEARLVDGGTSLELTFRDLGLEEGLWDAACSTYRVGLLDRDASATWAGRDGTGRQRVTLPLDADDLQALTRAEADDPVVVTLTVRRDDGVEGRPAHLRLRGTPDGGVEVVGLLH